MWVRMLGSMGIRGLYPQLGVKFSKYSELKFDRNDPDNILNRLTTGSQGRQR